MRMLNITRGEFMFQQTETTLECFSTKPRRAVSFLLCFGFFSMIMIALIRQFFVQKMMPQAAALALGMVGFLGFLPCCFFARHLWCPASIQRPYERQEMVDLGENRERNYTEEMIHLLYNDPPPPDYESLEHITEDVDVGSIDRQPPPFTSAIFTNRDGASMAQM